MQTEMKPANRVVNSRLHQVFQLTDLSSLSVSSVGPLFSVAAASAAMVQAAGPAVPIAIVAIAVPFILCSWIFLSLNQHFPSSGASYHWSRRIMGIDYSHFQGWIVIMAYFWSIPPILIPAARFTLGAFGIAHPSALAEIATSIGWATFSALVLLRGARMTALVTQAFLLVEILAVAVMTVIGYASWHRRTPGTATIALYHIHWAGVVACTVIAATIVDGWEIDSYASEEAKKPRLTPGWGGIIGAISVVIYYLLIWPLLLHEVPLAQLATSADALTLWAKTVVPSFVPWMRVSVIASTAGGLWLTTFILSRALFAMARDGNVPSLFGKLNRQRVPFWAIVIPIIISIAVVCMQVIVPSLNALFELVLSAAGFFLVAEFLLDGVNMLYFLVFHHHDIRHSIKAHHHVGMLAAAIIVVIFLASIEIAFLVLGPRDIAPGIDRVIVGLLALGILNVLRLKRRKTAPKTHIFADEPNILGNPLVEIDADC
ncbi:APC family permease [Acidithiobacillus sp.]|uniref:APC family permease n=1 Tax=Acidithiobacillus sp. TaxID=1872118 RepID=UPI003D01B4F0